MRLPAGKRCRVTAVLGPTNTGKTHLAVERMLGHRTGMIGFPLRLLAREIYDRVVAARGPGAAALVTGEEKRIPPNPKYFLCTVESMPLDRAVDFVAIDEIQLAADRERGHVFTDRLLHARGRDETMFLGAETIRPLLRRLVPEAEFIARPRFSKLSYAGRKKLSRLEPRSAIVAFSVANIYAVAEQMRRQRGGCAVVLGALSPSTRNAQVALYEAGEVDYLVATDAIGMGLNMDVNHVAFWSLSKFDGRSIRRLTAPELAQIAGRAGRHMSDGTFGGTEAAGDFEPELVEAIENHRFGTLKRLYWRNRTLNFRSPRTLLRSLEAGPPDPVLLRGPSADDSLALATLAKDSEVGARASNPGAVQTLWDVCQIPDFRKLSPESHAGLLKRIFLHLAEDDGRLPDDWIARHVSRLDRTDGDIETLMGRIAGIRTWTYVAHRSDWLDDAAGWQARSRAIEDRLSDALHDRLTQRFVDRRAAYLARRLRSDDRLLGTVTDAGDVIVEGHRVGVLDGFRFRPDPDEREDGSRLLTTAARRILTDAMAPRIAALCADPDRRFTLDETGAIQWRSGPVARLAPGEGLLTPQIALVPSDLLSGPQRDRLRRRLALWRDREIERRLGRLLRLADAPLKGAARGLAFQLVEGASIVACTDARDQINALTPADRRTLTDLGVKRGVHYVYVDTLQSGVRLELRARLWAAANAWHGPLPVPTSGRVSIAVDPDMPTAYYRVIGYPVFGPRAIRVDIAERLAARVRRLARNGPVSLTAGLATLAGCSTSILALVLAEMGFRPVEGGPEDALRFALPERKRPRGRARKTDTKRRKSREADDSPFAKLASRRPGDEDTRS